MADRIIAFLDGLNSEELERLPPARLRRFSELCFHWHQLAERRLKGEPKTGVLSRLKNGERSE